MNSPACRYCGFPLPGPNRDGPQPRFCCLGCRFAFAASRTDAAGAGPVLVLAKLGVAVFLTLNVVMFSMVLWSSDVYDAGVAPGQEPLSRVLNSLWRWLCGLLALPVLWLLGGAVVEQTLSGLRQGRWSMDGLLLVGIVAAYVSSWVAVVREEGPIYFEVGCVVLVLVTLGRWLEARGRAQATAALAALDRLMPDRVRRRNPQGEEEWLPLDAVAPGDELIVLPGERVPTDGEVIDGPATVDERLFTGESSPISKEVGERVAGGVTVVETPLYLRATTLPAASSLRRYLDLVRGVLAQPGRWQRRAERLAAWLLPAVVAVALGAMIWHGLRSGPNAGILAGLAVLLIACPCALGIATPLAVWNAVGQLAQRQVLLRDPDGLERLAEVRSIVLDKTGTLTTGEVRLRDETYAAEVDAEEARRLAACLAARSTHPLALALQNAWPACQPPYHAAVRTAPGRGLAAERCGTYTDVRLGSKRFLEEAGTQIPPALGVQLQAAIERGEMLSCLAWDGKLRGFFTFAEELRAEAAPALAALRTMVERIEILSGDLPQRAARLAAALGVAARGDQTPEDKLARLRALHERYGAVAMVGDGLNDAPALAAADVGIALGCGADLTRDTATICLLHNDLATLPWLWRLARRTTRVIRQNLFWAIIYNVLGVGLAACGWLNPVWAATAMVASSACVIGNSLRLAPPSANPAEADSPPLADAAPAPRLEATRAG